MKLHDTRERCFQLVQCTVRLEAECSPHVRLGTDTNLGDFNAASVSEWSRVIHLHPAALVHGDRGEPVEVQRRCPDLGPHLGPRRKGTEGVRRSRTDEGLDLHPMSFAPTLDAYLVLTRLLQVEVHSRFFAARTGRALREPLLKLWLRSLPEPAQLSR